MTRITAKNDLRLQNEKFKQNVRDVLVYLGLKMTIGNFQKYDKWYGSKTPIDWNQFADNINNGTTEPEIINWAACAAEMERNYNENDSGLARLEPTEHGPDPVCRDKSNVKRDSKVPEVQRSTSKLL